MKIAVIGWGSLIWDRRGLDVAPGWRDDGPLLPVEFARFSGRQRLTLVLVEGLPLQPTLWTLSKKSTLTAAAADLRARERTTLGDIGCWPGGNAGVAGAAVVAEVAGWAQGMKLDGAVWTALEPNRPDQQRGIATSEERIAYLKDLVARGQEAAAREYVEKAPEQIDTPLRRRIRDELGWR